MAYYNTGLTTESWFSNWFIANYLNDKTIDSAYGYTYPVGKATPTEWHLSGQIESEIKSIKELRSMLYVGSKDGFKKIDQYDQERQNYRFEDDLRCDGIYCPEKTTLILTCNLV